MGNTEINTELLIKKINTIMANLNGLIHRDFRTDTAGTVAEMHDLYMLARDCRDMLTFDAVSRDVMRKLAGDTEYSVCGGFKISHTALNDVREHVKSSNKLEGIKYLRARYSFGLKDAKDIYEMIEERFTVTDPPVVD